jgi:hypothetical protein
MADDGGGKEKGMISGRYTPARENNNLVSMRCGHILVSRVPNAHHFVLYGTNFVVYVARDRVENHLAAFVRAMRMIFGGFRYLLFEGGDFRLSAFYFLLSITRLYAIRKVRVVRRRVWRSIC